jgi:purine nucleosidase
MTKSIRPDVRVIIDTDTGIDDAIAIMYLANQANVEILACTTTHGNCSVDDSAANARYVLDLCELPDVPIFLGRNGTIAGGPPNRSFHVHGEDGLGDLGLGSRDPRAEPETAAAALVRIAQERPGEVDLLVLGPTTNIADALALDPDLLTRFRVVVVMGGSGPYPLEGRMQEVDANVQSDQEAARVFWAAPKSRLVMVGVNVTTPTILDETWIAAVAAGDGSRAKLATAALSRYLDFYEFHWGRRICSAHDPLAAAVLADPSLVLAGVEGPVNVLSDGYSVRARVMRLMDGEPPAVTVVPAPEVYSVTAVDADRFKQQLLDALLDPR